eukprot:g1278.t1
MCKKLGFGTGVLANEHDRTPYRLHDLFYDSDALPIGACPEFAASLDSCNYYYGDEEHYMRDQCRASTAGIVLYIICFDSAEQECLLRPGDRRVWNSENEVCNTIADFHREQEEEARRRCENFDCSNGYVAFKKESLNCTCRECEYYESMHGTWDGAHVRDMHKIEMTDVIRGSCPELFMITVGRDEIYAMVKNEEQFCEENEMVILKQRSNRSGRWYIHGCGSMSFLYVGYEAWLNLYNLSAALDLVAWVLLFRDIVSLQLLAVIADQPDEDDTVKTSGEASGQDSALHAANRAQPMPLAKPEASTTPAGIEMPIVTPISFSPSPSAQDVPIVAPYAGVRRVSPETVNAPTGGGMTLAEKLHQLEVARTQGLLSEEEFRAAKQSVIQNMIK